MSHADFNEFALLWQEEPTAEEKREFRGLAMKASRRAQLLHYAELGLGVILILAVLIAVSMAPAPATIAIGALTIAALGWSSWKRHLLAQVALLVDNDDRDVLVGKAIVRTEANLRRSTIGLWFLFPGVAAGAALTHAYQNGGDMSGFGGAWVERITSWPQAAVPILLLVLLTGTLLRRHFLLKQELANLRELSEDYREESRLDARALG